MSSTKGISNLILSPYSEIAFFVFFFSTWLDWFEIIWMLAQSRGLHRIRLPRIHRILSTSFRNHVVSLNLPQRSSSTLTMAHPPHSSADSVRIPPLESEHVDSVVSTVSKTDKQPKDKKNSKVAPTASGYPLEVRASACRYSVFLSHFFHSVATASGISWSSPEDLYWT
jgi:hypothetical protein